MQKFSMVGSYTENLENHKTVKIGGRVLAQGWVLVCLGQYGNYRTDSLTSMEQKFLPLELLYHMTGCFCGQNFMNMHTYLTKTNTMFYRLYYLWLF